MKAPSISRRMKFLPGMLVREIAQAIGTAKIRHSTVTIAPRRREFHSAVM